MNLLNQLRDAWTVHRRQAQTVRELEQLSDRVLADLGIARADIRNLARDAARAEGVDLQAWRGRAGATAAPRHDGVDLIGSSLGYKAA
jgi:uncharacterized protein YjiS (DUF1127 family)